MALYDITPHGDSFEFDPAFGVTPSTVIELDSTHFIVASNGELLDGYINIVELDRSTWTFTGVSELEYDTSQGKIPSIYKMSDTKILCVYGGVSDDGFAVIITIDPSDWSMTAGSAIEFDLVDYDFSSIEMIDPTHMLVTWAGNSLVKSQIFTVDLDANTISPQGTPLEVSTSASAPVTEKFDTNHVLVGYTVSNEWVLQVLEVNTSTWEVTKVGTPLTSIQAVGSVGGKVMKKLTDTMFVCVYQNIFTGSGEAFTGEVNLATWDVTQLSDIVQSFGSGSMRTGEATLLDANHLIYTNSDISSDGWFNILEIDLDNGDVTVVGTPYEFEPDKFSYGSGTEVTISGTTDKFAFAWQDVDSDGRIQVFSVELPSSGEEESGGTRNFLGFGGISYAGYGKEYVKVGKHYVTRPKTIRRR